MTVDVTNVEPPRITPAMAQKAAEYQMAAALALGGVAGAVALLEEMLYALRRMVGWQEAPVPTHEFAKGAGQTAMTMAEQAAELQLLARKLREQAEQGS